MPALPQKDDDIPAPRAPLPIVVDEFLTGMPAAYHAQFSEADARDHAAIVWRRNGAVAHVEQWLGPDRHTVWLCVVTDDQPGLLASLAAAITAHSLNILDAKIYCHEKKDDRSEAVDFFRVSPIKGPEFTTLTRAEVVSLRSTVIAAIQGRIDLRALRRRASPTLRSMTRPETVVYFDGESNYASRLIVETKDQPGLLAGITSALFKASVSIVWSNVSTIAGQARDEFHLLAPDGRALSTQHKEQVVSHVVAAMNQLEAQKDPQDDRELAESDSAAEDRLSQIQMAEPVPLSRPHRFSKIP